MTCKLCIFGASGATGTILTKLAVKRGLDVTVFMRSEIAREIIPQGVTTVVGNLLNPGDVERAITGAMVGNYPYLSWFMRRIMSAYQKQQPALAHDRTEQEKLVESSGLDWTLIKPPRLSNGKARGHIRSGGALRVEALSSISHADLSHFILDQVDAQKYVCNKVVVQY